tara:strand:+ start:102 stop:239 length:138 start_codon:yes stop_codon:yes gene_type:complete
MKGAKQKWIKTNIQEENTKCEIFENRSISNKHKNKNNEVLENFKK